MKDLINHCKGSTVSIKNSSSRITNIICNLLPLLIHSLGEAFLDYVMLYETSAFKMRSVNALFSSTIR